MNVIKSCRYGPMAYNSNDIYIGRSFQDYGEFSEGECAVFRAIVNPGDTVLDIGSNIGAHTIPLAQLVGPNGIVMAFEPQRLVYYLLCTNTSLNGLENVICLQNAVGREPGRITVPELNFREINNFGGVELGDSQDKGFSVRVVTVDSFNLTKASLLKIDVEGMENEVLLGATETIRNCRPLLYIENDRRDKSAELINTVRKMGYEIYFHAPPLFNEANHNRNPNNVFGSTVSINIFCHPSERDCPIDTQAFGMSQVGREKTVVLAKTSPERHRAIIEGTKLNVVEGLMQIAENYANGTFEIDPAMDYLSKAVNLSGCDPKFLQRAFPILMNYRKFKEGLALAEAGIQVGWDQAMFYKAYFLSAIGKIEESTMVLFQFLKLHPDNIEAKICLAMDLLKLGRYEEGFALYENRLSWETPNLINFRSNLPKDVPAWVGGWVSNKRLLIYNEQGAGDMIQFSRYIPIIKFLGNPHIVLACPKPLASLMRTISGVSEVIEIDEYGHMEVPPVDFQCSLLSLPHIMKTKAEDVPWQKFYLRAPQTIDFGVKSLPGVKIGICWAGSELLHNDPARSCPLRHFAALSNVPGVSLVSLQIGPMIRQWPTGTVNLLEGSEDVNLYDVTDMFTDYAATASLIEQLDMVITVDTSVAHLAGALGKKTWVMLPDSTCWRWLDGKDTSPWYPRMRIFKGGDWETTLRRVAWAVKVEEGIQ